MASPLPGPGDPPRTISRNVHPKRRREQSQTDDRTRHRHRPLDFARSVNQVSQRLGCTVGYNSYAPETFNTASEESLLRSRILPAFGEMSLSGIEPHDVDGWVSGMIDESLSASRIRQAHSVLGKMLKAAMRSRYISHNPALGASLPSIRRREMMYLDPAETDRLAGCIDPRFRVWVYTMAWTGLRFGEAAALRRRNVDILRSKLRIVESVTEVDGATHFGTTKTNRNRTVHMPAFLRDMLNDHLISSVGPDADALVFTSADGAVLRRHNFGRRQWKPATRAAALDPLRVHDLRHTAAALMINVNESPETVKRQLGHSSIKVTFDVYGHLFPSSMESLAEGLDRLYRAAQAD